MKSLLTLILMAASLSAYSQKKGITVSVQKQSINVSLDDDSDQQITIHANIKSAENLKIINNLDEKEWKRSFEIFDSTGQPLLKVPASNQIAYQVSIKEIRAGLKKGMYSLYTMALPKDQKMAASIRVGRVLVCRILVK